MVDVGLPVEMKPLPTISERDSQGLVLMSIVASHMSASRNLSDTYESDESSSLKVQIVVMYRAKCAPVFRGGCKCRHSHI